MTTLDKLSSRAIRLAKTYIPAMLERWHYPEIAQRLRNLNNPMKTAGDCEDFYLFLDMIGVSQARGLAKPLHPGLRYQTNELRPDHRPILLMRAIVGRDLANARLDEAAADLTAIRKDLDKAARMFRRYRQAHRQSQ